MARKTLRWHRWSTLVVELVGLAVSTYLLLISLKVLYPGNVPCPRGSWFHCHSVLRGEWSKIGPIPISLLGTLYFLAQAFLTVAAEKRRTWASATKLAFGIGGLLFLAWLRAVEIVWLRGLCPWCWAVVVCTLVELTLLYPLASPPLPRVGWIHRIGWVVGAFLVAVVVATGLGYFAYERQQRAARHELATVRTRPAEATRSPVPTRVELPRPPAASAPTKAPPVTPKSKVAPPRNEGSVEEGVPVTNEVKILVKHGWTVVASAQSVEKYIREESPVLLLVFDPWCDECQAFIRGGLESDEIRRQPVKLVAIEQGSLTGKWNSEVTHVPTLLLIDRQGNILFRHEGRMTTNELLAALDRHLKP